MAKTFVLDTNEIRLNIDTSSSGVAYAALLEESGGEIQNYGLEQCDRIQGNDTQYTISWNGNKDVSPLRGKRVRLLLKSRSAKLFAVYYVD